MVLIDRSHKAWFAVSVAMVMIAAAAYAGYASSAMHGVSGGSVPGLLFGIVGSAMMTFAAFLAVRKRLPTWRVGSAQCWLRGHIWLGTVGFVFILFHSGFGWGGLLENLLWITFGLTVLTGFVGVALQQVIPRLLTTRVPLETMVAQIPFLSRTMLFRADQLVAKQVGVLDVEFESLKPFAKAVLQQQRILKRESDFLKELAKVYGNLPIPEGDAKKSHRAESTATTSAKSPFPLGEVAAPVPVITADSTASPAAMEKAKSPIELMRTKMAARQAAPVMKPTTSPPDSDVSAPSEPKAPAPIPSAQLAALRDFHIRVVRPFLHSGRSAWHRLDDPITAQRVFAQLNADLPAELHETVRRIEEFCDERRQYVAQQRLHRWMHCWLMLHIPPSIALLVLFAAHVVVSLRVVPFGK